MKPDIHAFQAAARFGLGATPGELKKIGNDPRGWIYEQINYSVTPPEVMLRYTEAEVQKAIANSGRMRDREPVMSQEMDTWGVFWQETHNRIKAQIKSTQPCAERMVNFWSNHFTVAANKTFLGAEINKYEVEAIRPHIGGHFKDMLKAVVRHPAMQLYLDNFISVGPNSTLGRRSGQGLNENLAREILELHTLGVDGGYNQQDVIELAKMLTGWSIDRNWGEPLPQYQFHPNRHEPGNKTLLGRSFREMGEEEATQALDFLAAHPSTARFIATKLARHYISDTPNPRDVEYIAASFAGSEGHIPTVMNTVTSLDNTWNQPLNKFKSPYDYVVSALRTLQLDIQDMNIMRLLRNLNYSPFQATSPAGFPDTAADWASADAIMKRVEWAYQVSAQASAASSPQRIAEMVIGPVMSERTAFEIKAAPTTRDGFTLLLSSPEFQRR